MAELHLEGISMEQLNGRTLTSKIVLNHFPAVLGRQSDCDCCLNFAFISRRHCAFFVRDGNLWVQDLGSQNGTLLNGEPLRDAHPLHEGDRLDLCCLAFRVAMNGCTAATHEDASTVIVAKEPAQEVIACR